MRNYVYISDAKVDMYLPQVSRTVKQEIASKLGFNLKVLEGEIGTKRRNLEDRVARLQVVETALRNEKNEQIGTSEYPGAWLADTAEARGILAGEPQALLYYILNRKWMVVLAGSPHHLIGASPQVNTDIPLCFAPELLKLLQVVSDDDALWGMYYSDEPKKG